MIQENLREYPDDQKINIAIYTADDFDPSGFSSILTFKDCILMTVSGPTLDNSAVASIGEISVVFKSSYIDL